MKTHLILPAFIALWIMLLHVSAAQQAWVHHTGGSCVTLEAVKPFFGSDCPNYDSRNDLEPNITSSNIYLGAFIGVSPRLAIVAELPVATHWTNTVIPYNGPVVGIDPPMVYDDERPSGTVLGNPLIGAVYGLEQLPLSATLAMRIPVTGGGYDEGELFAMNAGRYADFERKDAFTRNAMPLMTSLTYTFRREDMPHTLRLQAGGKLVFFAGQSTANAQVYSAVADLHFAPMHFRAIYMTYTVDMDAHLQDVYGLSAGIHLGRFTPGVGVRWLASKVVRYYAGSAMMVNLTYRFED